MSQGIRSPLSWSAKRSARTMIMKVEFAWPEVTKVELLAMIEVVEPVYRQIAVDDSILWKA